MAITWRPAPIPKPTIGSWLPKLKKSWRIDTVAGITVWGLIVPEAIAYSGLAGLPPTSGMWAIVFVLPIYAIWGGSRHLVASPTSAIAVTTGSIVAAFATSDPRQAGAIIALTVGATFLLAYFLRLGFIVHFISEPINAGFMFGIAVFVLISQANKIFGVEGSHGTALERLAAVVQHLPETNPVAVGLSVLAAALMILLPRISPRIPEGLVMILVTSVVVAVFQLPQRYGIDTPGAIPTGLPSPVTPSLGHGDVTMLITGGVGIVLVAFSEASAVARSIALKEGYDYDPSRDLFPLGVGNAISGVFGGLSGAGSLTSSSENEEAGAKTPFSTLVAALAALLTVTMLGGAVANLPEAALAVLIIFAVRNHLSLAFVPRIYRYSPAEALIAGLAALGVLVLGVLNGLLLAMAFSIAWYIVKTNQVYAERTGLSKLSRAALVRESDPNYMPFPPGVKGIRFDGTIFYGNIGKAVTAIQKVAAEKPCTAVVVSTGPGLNDYTSIGQLMDLVRELEKHGVWLVAVNVQWQLHEAFVLFGRLPHNLLLVEGTDLHPVLECIQQPPPGPGEEPDPALAKAPLLNGSDPVDDALQTRQSRLLPSQRGPDGVRSCSWVDSGQRHAVAGQRVFGHRPRRCRRRPRVLPSESQHGLPEGVGVPATHGLDREPGRACRCGWSSRDRELLGASVRRHRIRQRDRGRVVRVGGRAHVAGPSSDASGVHLGLPGEPADDQRACGSRGARRAVPQQHRGG